MADDDIGSLDAKITLLTSEFLASIGQTKIPINELIAKLNELLATATRAGIGMASSAATSATAQEQSYSKIRAEINKIKSDLIAESELKVKLATMSREQIAQQEIDRAHLQIIIEEAAKSEAIAEKESAAQKEAAIRSILDSVIVQEKLRVDATKRARAEEVANEKLAVAARKAEVMKFMDSVLLAEKMATANTEAAMASIVESTIIGEKLRVNAIKAAAAEAVLIEKEAALARKAAIDGMTASWVAAEATELEATKVAKAEEVFIEESAASIRKSAVADMMASWVAAEEYEVSATRIAAGEKVGIEREAARARIEANREAAVATAELTGAAYLTGGYAGARATRAVTVMSAPVMAAVGVAAATYEVVKYTIEAEKAAQATDNFAQALGISWSQARNLQEMATITGVSINTLEQASGRIAVAMDSSSKAGGDLRKALIEIGVEGHTSGELLLNFITYLSQIPDSTTRIAEARRVLGRGSAEMDAFVMGMRDATGVLAELGPSIGDNLGSKLANSAKYVHELSVAWDRFKDSLATMPVLPDVIMALLRGGSMFLSGSHGKEEAMTGWAMTAITGANPVSNLFVLKGQYDALIEAKAKAAEQDKKDLELLGHMPEHFSAMALINTVIAKTLKDQNDARVAGHQSSLEGMKAELAEQKTAMADADKASRDKTGIISEPERKVALDTYDKAKVRVDDLELRIKEAEGKLDKAADVARGRAFGVKSDEVNAKIKDTIAQWELANPEPIVADKRSEGFIESLAAKALYDLQKAEAINKATQAGLGELQTFPGGTSSERREANIPARRTTADDTEFATRQKVMREYFTEYERYESEQMEKSSRLATEEGKREARATEEFIRQFQRRHEEIVKDDTSANKIMEASGEEHDKRSRDLQIAAIEFRRKQGAISTKDAVDREGAITTAAEKSALADVASQKRLLEATKDTNSQYNSQMAEQNRREQVIKDNATARLQKEAQEKALGSALDQQVYAERKKITDLESNGPQSMQAANLANEKIQVDLLKHAYEGLGGIYADLVTEAYAAFSKVGQTFADVLLEPHKKGVKELHEAIKSLEKETLGTIFTDVLKGGLGKLIPTPKTAADAAALVAENANTAALNAAIAAIYDLIGALSGQPGMGLASHGASSLAGPQQVQAQAKAAHASIWKGILGGALGMVPFVGGLLKGALAGFGGGGGGGGMSMFAGYGGGDGGGSDYDDGSLSFGTGGRVPKTGYHHLEMGEHVLDTKLSSDLRKSMERGSMGSGGDHIHLTLHGHFSDSEIDHIMDRVVKKGRRIGAPA